MNAKKWLNATGVATRQVAKGLNGTTWRLASRLLPWSHRDFHNRFPGFEGSGLCIDHIIPRACAIRPDGTIDQAFADAVLGLDNLRLIDARQNSIKGSTIDRAVAKRSIELRRDGMAGADLFAQLWVEFKEKATSLSTMPAVVVVEEAPVSRWPAVQGELFFQEVES